MRHKWDFTKLGISLGVCLGAGGLGSLFTKESLTAWYPMLVKPAFTPPNWVFPVVWTILYLMMGSSLYLVWKKGFIKPRLKRAFSIFGIQLALNVGWSVAFFGLRSPLLGLYAIAALWAAILITMRRFFCISRLASRLLVPYFIWVTFAAVLNFFIWKLNK